MCGLPPDLFVPLNVGERDSVKGVTRTGPSQNHDDDNNQHDTCGCRRFDRLTVDVAGSHRCDTDSRIDSIQPTSTTKRPAGDGDAPLRCWTAS